MEMEVLLIGSSFSAVPMLAAIKRRGGKVTVIGKYTGDPCHAYADRSIFEDYSDRDMLLSICRENSFDFIVPSCNDYSYRAASHVADKLGFPGLDNPETTAILHTKNRFRHFCGKIGAPVPKMFGELSDGCRSLTDGFEGPVIVKPVDSFSGRGVQIVHKAEELAAAAERAFAESRSGAVVVEQFVEGTLHSHTAFIVSGRVIWHDFVDEFCEVYPYQVDRSTYPSRLPAGRRGEVNISIERLVSALNICDGLLHTQFIASDAGFWIIECMRRCPGDLYGYHFKLALDYDYEAQYIASFLGDVPAAPVSQSCLAQVERRVLSVDSEHAFFGVALGSDTGSSMYVPLKNSGERLGPAPFDKAGIVFLYGGTDTSRELGGPASRVVSHEGLFLSAAASLGSSAIGDKID